MQDNIIDTSRLDKWYSSIQHTLMINLSNNDYNSYLYNIFLKLVKYDYELSKAKYIDKKNNTNIMRKQIINNYNELEIEINHTLKNYIIHSNQDKFLLGLIKTKYKILYNKY